jgi:hypothetical protein
VVPGPTSEAQVATVEVAAMEHQELAVARGLMPVMAAAAAMVAMPKEAGYSAWPASFQ